MNGYHRNGWAGIAEIGSEDKERSDENERRRQYNFVKYGAIILLIYNCTVVPLISVKMTVFHFKLFIFVVEIVPNNFK